VGSCEVALKLKELSAQRRIKLVCALLTAATSSVPRRISWQPSKGLLASHGSIFLPRAVAAMYSKRDSLGLRHRIMASSFSSVFMPLALATAGHEERQSTALVTGCRQTATGIRWPCRNEA
jgi:hypothetical protein